MTDLPRMPFRPRMVQKILEGTKTATSRMKKYGAPGDMFRTSRGAVIELVAVKQMTLGRVADTLFTQEGFASPDEFVDYWQKLHPRAGFDGLTKVWVHRFRQVLDA